MTHLPYKIPTFTLLILHINIESHPATQKNINPHPPITVLYMSPDPVSYLLFVSGIPGRSDMSTDHLVFS